MDITKQGLTGGKAQTATYIQDTLKISFPNFGIQYVATLQNDILVGNLKQGGGATPLNLARGTIQRNRPQEPKPPYSYTVEEINFKNPIDNTTFAATLTTPKNKEKFPVAIIVSGSGPQDRDGSMFGHKPYHVLADYLTNNGIGVLRYDERGVGASAGTFATATLEDFESDVQAAIAYLKSRKEINTTQLGLIGHSIGGIIAPKLATTDPSIKFVVMMAGPGIKGKELMLSQKIAMEKLMGVTEEQGAFGNMMLGGAYDVIVASTAKGDALKVFINQYFATKYATVMPENQRVSTTEQITAPEIVAILRTNPETYLSKLRVPLLAIDGSKDFQVEASANLNAIKTIMAKTTNKKVTTTKLENLNHLFQESTTGNISEYAEIEQTMSPIALNIIAKWINGEMK